jgi:class 3 adenylate cyclase
MAAPRVDRRLAAIMAVDAVGYSRLMATDEAGTVARLKTLRREFIEPTIAEHHGRIVKVTGDGALVEFPSVVDAVCCAIELQRGTTERARNVPQDRQIRFRIGINLGDIIIEDDDLHGDGVNIAVRLEALAEPGGICISRTVRDHVQDKLGLALKDLGKLTLKNIPRPVHVFRVLPESAAMAGRSRVDPINPRRLWAAAAAVVVLLIAGGGARLWLHSDDGGTVPRQQAGTPTMPSEAYGGTAQVALDKYRIAVLPFSLLGQDHKGHSYLVICFPELGQKMRPITISNLVFRLVLAGCS